MKKFILTLFLIFNFSLFAENKVYNVEEDIAEQYRMGCGFNTVIIYVPNEYYTPDILEYVELRFRFRNHIVSDVIHEETHVKIVGRRNRC